MAFYHPHKKITGRKEYFLDLFNFIPRSLQGDPQALVHASAGLTLGDERVSHVQSHEITTTKGVKIGKIVINKIREVYLISYVRRYMTGNIFPDFDFSCNFIFQLSI